MTIDKDREEKGLDNKEVGEVNFQKSLHADSWYRLYYGPLDQSLLSVCSDWAGVGLLTT